MPKTQRAVKSRRPAAPAKRNGNNYEALNTRLLQQRDEMMSMYKRDLRVGQESSEDGTEDIVDRANNAYHRELMFSLSDGERQLLLQIQEALARMENGAYGACVHCGETITMPRLQAVPWTRYCIDCQELQEKGMLED